MQMGPVAPFDASMVVLLLGGAVIAATWPENYGDAARHNVPMLAGLKEQFAVAVGAIMGGEGRGGAWVCRRVAGWGWGRVGRVRNGLAGLGRAFVARLEIVCAGA